MTGTFHYPPTASAPPQPVTGTAGPIQLAVDRPATQRRATVAVRLILVLPHLAVLYFLSLVSQLVAVIGWCCALATGRLPDFAATYQTGFLRWYARVSGYHLLLTDRYPPFTFEDDATYPVRLAVRPGRLNRLTVLFRLILAIPAVIVAYLLTTGFATIVLFIGWLTALVAGRLPESFHQAFTAVLRYSVRYLGYLNLLTGDYPGQLFGDQPGQQAEAARPAAGHDAAPGYGAAGYGVPGYGAPGYGTPGYGTAGYPDARYQAPWSTAPAPRTAGEQDSGWQLVLSPGARRLVGVLLVLGLLTAAAGGAGAGVAIAAARHRAALIRQLTADVTRFSGVVARHNAAAARARDAAEQINQDISELDTAHTSLITVLNNPNTDASGCTTVYCFQVTSAPLARGFTAFGRTLRAIPVPPGSAAIAKKLSADTAASAQDWQASTQAPTLDSLGIDFNAAERDGSHFDSDYSALKASLDRQNVAEDNKVTKLDIEAFTLNREGAALNRRAAALNVTLSVPTAQKPV